MFFWYVNHTPRYLGFATRDSFYDLEKREEFSYTMRRFRLFMTHWNEQKIYWGGTFQGASLWLRNWGGYKDEVTQNQNQTITKVEPKIVGNDVPRAGSESEVNV